jgi:hypothetical protein
MYEYQLIDDVAGIQPVENNKMRMSADHSILPEICIGDRCV